MTNAADAVPSSPTTNRGYPRLGKSLANRLRKIVRLRRLYVIWAELRWVPNEAQRLLILTVAIGLVCGFAAVAYHFAIQVAERYLINAALDSSGYFGMARTIATCTLGGAGCGLLLSYVVPNARGSGIPQVKSAFAGRIDRLRMRDSAGKFAISALQIGSGASLGREGPTVQICAGLASSLGRALGVSPQKLRSLLPVGASAGIAAAFNAPIAAVTFTVEEVLGQLDQAMLSGVIVAAAIAAVIERKLLGSVASIHRDHELVQMKSILICLAIGIAAAGVSLVFTTSLLGLRAQLKKLKRIPEWCQPAIGGLVTGILVVAALRTMNARGVNGGGYETLSAALNGALPLRIMLLLCMMKLAATVFSYSSGGAGGIFAPTLFIGAMLGGAIGTLGRTLMHISVDPIGSFALVGMGAVFAGIIRAPITSVLIVVEMTGSYSLILPLMLANTTSYLISRKFSGTPIYDALLEQDGVHLKTQHGSEDFENVNVDTVLNRSARLVAFSEYMTAEELLRQWHSGSPQDIYPVIDKERRLLGVIAAEDLKLVHSEPVLVPLANACDLMRPTLRAHPDDALKTALDRMVSVGTPALPVVDENDCLLGMIDEASIAKTYLRRQNPNRTV